MEKHGECVEQGVRVCLGKVELCVCEIKTVSWRQVGCERMTQLSRDGERKEGVKRETDEGIHSREEWRSWAGDGGIIHPSSLCP